MKLFNMDGPIFSFLGKMADLCILNIVFLITCLPVVTIGASISAMYYVTLKMVHNEEGYIIRSFYKAFRQNFRQATAIWVPSALAIILMLVDIRIFGSDPKATYQPLLIGAYLILLIIFYMLTFVFPVLAKFENTIGQTVKNAFAMSISRLPYALCILVLVVTPTVLTVMLPQSLSFVYMLWLLFGYSLTALGVSYIFEYKIFKKYLSED